METKEGKTYRHFGPGIKCRLKALKCHSTLDLLYQRVNQGQNPPVLPIFEFLCFSSRQEGGFQFEFFSVSIPIMTFESVSNNKMIPEYDWSLEVPLKIKNFAWYNSLGILRTRTKAFKNWESPCLENFLTVRWKLWNCRNKFLWGLLCHCLTLQLLVLSS